ncbi:MAG: hypothetical protein Fur0010_05770 [Bdellovibrio sp.]
MSKRSQNLAQEWYEQFLFEKPLNETFWFDQGHQLGVHWTNSKEGRELVRQWIYTSEGKLAFDRLKDQVEALKHQIVWITRHRDFIKSNLFDLYQFYLDPRIRLSWIHGSDKTMVSFHAESGPFIEVKSLRWLDRDILRNFMMIKLIEGKAQERACRLSTDISLTIERPAFSLKSYQMKLQQITDRGILVRFDGGHIIEQIARGDGWMIKASAQHGPFRVLNGKVNFNVTYPSFGGNNDQHYILLRYDQFEHIHAVSEIAKEIHEWSQAVREITKKAA